MALDALLDAVERLPAFQRILNTLPAPGGRLSVGGLPGSSDAVLVAALARRLPTRFFAIAAEGVGAAERWLADLETLFGDETPLALYPAREGFGEAEPHMEIAGERVETLEKLTRGELRVLLTTARALLEKTRMPRALKDLRVELRKGASYRLRELADHLEAIGFERVTLVEDVAQFSIRGGIFDVYSFGMTEPVRAEFWGDEIVDLRHFDLVSQRSSRAVDYALVLPVDGHVREDAGGEYDRASIATLFPPDTLLIVPRGEHIEPELRRTWQDAAHHIELARKRGEDIIRREELFETPETTLAALSRLGTLTAVEADGAAEVTLPLRSPEAVDRDIKQLKRLVRDGTPTVILCDNEGQCERLDELLSDEFIGPSPAALSIGVLDGGFIVPPAGGFNGLRILTDHEIFRRERRIRRARRYISGSAALDTMTLKNGDFVVHLEHGVGIYRGIETIFVGQSTIEVAVVEYEGGDRLNVPLYRIDQLERYRSADDVSEDSPPPRLHHLGGKRWAAQRDKARAAIQEMTVELLDLYARRKISTRPPHVPDTPWQRQLESAFLFEDTPDQRTATTQVKADMESTRPMDRLLVGDVGYGKTEIAVRAAFKAVQSGKQVAVLVPTTILADQHQRTFSERLADFPIRTAALSRFQSAKEQSQILVEIAEKKIDIVIGTHRLLSPDVQFKELGLIVIDEEHRFGVKHKERLKQLKLQTDVLTLTATPIPRTLHLSLAGLRDMTLMQTPPRDRSPVLTYVEPWDDGLIDEGVSRELDRGGQVFFVHNRIETIQAIADHIKRIVPRARIAVAHGQMKEKELEDCMHSFMRGDIDVLVSTMIVESGLDVSNANTMFVNRADTFGLAQLYQLRGRVGRSHRRAYCYLLVPDSVDPDAERRLQVLEHHTELGAGYRIALKDLEMRGAGNLLGAEQSGFVHAVGFDMYLRMLEETVRRLMSGDAAPKLVPSDVTIDTPNYLPDDYVVSQDAKIDVYKRLARFEHPADIEALRLELRDRFGPLPAPAEAMLALAQLRVIGGAMGIEGILVRGDEARITFRDSAAPRVKGLSAAFHDVQFQAEVRRAVPLSLKLTRLGGAPMLDGLVRALRGLVT
ncbi:MAG TPA: transcription-repair coupling factor [Gemmatimonadaceae bacterium]|nr:transcription-repair coupling factor [Gemmatimonadaceae bacterium]